MCVFYQYQKQNCSSSSSSRPPREGNGTFGGPGTLTVGVVSLFGMLEFTGSSSLRNKDHSNQQQAHAE
jgi:hypothetical protein